MKPGAFEAAEINLVPFELLLPLNHLAPER